MAANLNKNPETSKYLGTFFVKKTKSRITTIGTRSRSEMKTSYHFAHLITTLSIRSNSFTFANKCSTFISLT